MISSDRFFQNHFLSLGDVGIYSIGFLISTAINILFVQPFSLIWSPIRMEYRGDSNSREFFSILPTYYFLIGLTICLFIALFSYELLYFFTSNSEFIEAHKIIPIISLAFLIFGSMNLFDHGIFFNRKVYWHSIIFFVCFCINCLLNFLLIPIYGYPISSVILLFTFIFGLIAVIIISNRIDKYSFKIMRIPALFMIYIFVSYLGYLLNNSIDIYQALFLKAMLLIIYACIIFKFWFEESEIKYIKSLLN